MRRFFNKLANVASLVGLLAALALAVACARADEPEPMCGQSDLPVDQWDDDAFEQTPEDAALEAFDRRADELGWEWIDGVPGEAFHAYLIEKAYTRDETRIEIQRIMDADFAKASAKSGR